MELDILQDTHEEMSLAIEQGISLDDFVKTQTERLQKAGWWGRRLRRDPKTGELRDVLLGSPLRLRLIYSTNLRTSLAAGQWQPIEETRETHPYLLYQLGPSRIHRPMHVRWHGTLLPSDDPWWRAHFPPNGWNCRCWVCQVSKVEAEDKKWQVSERLPEKHRMVRDPNTGADVPVPEGIDLGWDLSHRRSDRLAELQATLQDKRRAAGLT